MGLFDLDSFKHKNNETPETPAPAPAASDEIQVTEIGADDSAIQSARDAVEAMKNNSFFSNQPVVAETPAAEAVASEGFAGGYDAPAASAAEAVARMNNPLPVTEPEAAPEMAPAEVVVPVVAEEAPQWKKDMDAAGSTVADKATQISESVKSQLAEIEVSVARQLQELQDTMKAQLQFVEESVKVAVKEAGASTERVVEEEKLKLTSAFDLEKQTMNAGFEQRVQELEEKHAAEIRELKEAQTQEISQMRDEKLNSLDKMKQMYSDQMEEMQTAYREKNAALKREMDQYKEKVDILQLQLQDNGAVAATVSVPTPSVTSPVEAPSAFE